MSVFWKIVAALLALVVFVGSYIAIGFFKCLSLWPRWLPFPSKKPTLESPGKRNTTENRKLGASK